jgi:IclR family transcriptional regulator, acetate operon repressor
MPHATLDVPGGAVGSHGDDYTIRAALRVCDILDHLRAHPAGTLLRDVAKVAGLPKSSAFRYLHTLESRHYVEREPSTGRYRVGLAFVASRPEQIEVVAAQIHPMLEDLAARVGETVTVGVLDATHVTYIDTVESQHAVRLSTPQGGHAMVHSTALGKAISAGLPDEHVRAILGASGMPRLTRNTSTDIDRFLAELGQVRERGWALDDAENDTDGRAIAVPMTAPLPAAVGLSAPASRLPLERVRVLANDLKAAAARMAASLRV